MKGMAKRFLLLLVAPFLGLAFVTFLPIAGFVVTAHALVVAILRRARRLQTARC